MTATNVGSTDRLARILAGAVLGTVSLVTLAGVGPLPDVAAPVLGLLALVPLVTGLTGTCGVYSALGIDTTGRS